MIYRKCSFCDFRKDQTCSLTGLFMILDAPCCLLTMPKASFDTMLKDLADTCLELRKQLDDKTMAFSWLTSAENERKAIPVFACDRPNDYFHKQVKVKIYNPTLAIWEDGIVNTLVANTGVITVIINGKEFVGHTTQPNILTKDEYQFFLGNQFLFEYWYKKSYKE